MRKKEQLPKDKYNKDIISYRFGDYRTYRITHKGGPHTCMFRKRKWLDRFTARYSEQWDISDSTAQGLTPSSSLF